MAVTQLRRILPISAITRKLSANFDLAFGLCQQKNVALRGQSGAI